MKANAKVKIRKRRPPLTPTYIMESMGSWLNIILLALIGFIMLYPFWYVFMYSLSDYFEVIGKGLIMRPYGFTLQNLIDVTKSHSFVTSYKNTIIVVVGGTILSVVVSGLLAYPLSQDVYGAKVFNFMIYFTMLFGGGMIPTYYVVRQTGLLDTLWSLILPCMLNSFNVIVMRSFYKGVPKELMESARIDGASEIRTFAQIVTPISKPIMATMVVFYAVMYWNKYVDAVLYIRDSEKRPLQLLLKQLIDAHTQNDITAEMPTYEANSASMTALTVKMSTVTLSVIPIMIIYPFLQKYFVTGATLGSVKG